MRNRQTRLEYSVICKIHVLDFQQIVFYYLLYDLRSGYSRCNKMPSLVGPSFSVSHTELAWASITQDRLFLSTLQLATSSYLLFVENNSHVLDTCLLTTADLLIYIGRFSTTHASKQASSTLQNFRNATRVRS